MPVIKILVIVSWLQNHLSILYFVILEPGTLQTTSQMLPAVMYSVLRIFIFKNKLFIML